MAGSRARWYQSMRRRGSSRARASSRSRPAPARRGRCGPRAGRFGQGPEHAAACAVSHPLARSGRSRPSRSAANSRTVSRHRRSRGPPGRRRARQPQQALVDQLIEPRPGPRTPRSIARRRRPTSTCSEADTAAEHRARCQQPPGAGAPSRPVTPGDRVAQSLLARRQVLAAAGQQRQALAPSRASSAAWREQFAARRRQLDRQRQPITVQGAISATAGGRCSVVDGRSPAPHRLGALNEQPHRLVTASAATIGGRRSRSGMLSGGHAVLALAVQMQRLAAGDPDRLQRRCAGQQFRATSGAAGPHRSKLSSRRRTRASPRWLRRRSSRRPVAHIPQPDALRDRTTGRSSGFPTGASADEVHTVRRSRR